jgi:hypothetical protein
LFGKNTGFFPVIVRHFGLWLWLLFSGKTNFVSLVL